MRRCLFLLGLLAFGCSPPPGKGETTVLPTGTTGGAPPVSASGFAVTSPDFQNNGPLPDSKTPPRLMVTGVPANTGCIAVEMVDPDAGNPPFVHWLVVNASVSSGAVTGGVQGKNDGGQNGYYPPSPPNGETHHYHIKVFALGHELQVGDGFSQADLEKYSQGDILAQTEIVGTFQSK